PQVARAEPLSSSILAVIIAVTLIFGLLGAIVYRWAPDRAVRTTFLIFAGSGSIVLGAVPAATMGYGWAFFLASSAASVFATTFTTYFLIFPRPLRLARQIIVVQSVVVGTIILAEAILAVRDEVTPPPINL